MSGSMSAQNDSIHGFSVESDVLYQLTKAEFENLRCIARDSTLLVSFENREYRSDAEAIAVVIKILLPLTKHFKKLSILYLELGIPITKIDFAIPEGFDSDNFKPDERFWRDHLSYSYHLSEEWDQLSQNEKQNSTFGKIDLEFEPRISLQLGDFINPFKFEFFAFPALNLNLWKGAYFHGSAYLPVFSYKHSNKYRYFRSRIISLTQNFGLGSGKFLKLTTGTFSTNRIGVEAEWNSYHLNGMLQLTASGAYTGFFRYLKKGYEGLYGSYYDHNVIEYTMPYYWTYQVGAEVRIPKTEVAVAYSYGRYLYEDNGHKLLIYRNFNEYLMGVQAYWGEGNRNLGFYVYLPLIPSRYYLNKKIRVKPSKYLNYSYLASSDFYWYFRTGYYPDLEYLEVNPQVIVNQLPLYLLLENRNENKQKNKN
jgi:hypothetical protein